ncbi:MAG: hypothetical protein ACHP6H_05760 [Legionellales bacterium]
MPKTIEELERQYINEEWSYIDAIEILQNRFCKTAKEAEELVSSWED